jgi:hypothetical protein
MAKVKKTKTLRFIGGCSAVYHDEDGLHGIKPGDPPVKFSQEMYDLKILEGCWEDVEDEKPKKEGGE